MTISIEIVSVMAVLGVVFGGLLAFANKKFKIEVNPLIHIVEDILPKGQCGACGYPGCMAYAEAVVTDPNVSPNLCIPGKDPVAKAVAELTGKKAEAIEPHVARVMCSGTEQVARVRYRYYGVPDCVEEHVLFGGSKSCKYGCLGLGSCMRACPFGAIEIGEDGLPVVDEFKCTACGKCQMVCPKKVIALIPTAAKSFNHCASKYKGQDVKKICTVGCIGCGVCSKVCKHGAITMVNNLPVIDHSKCAECKEIICAVKCPTKSMISL